jgi:formylglycine-generating enzyme required for sulfatase activity
MKMSPNSKINEGCKRLAERLLGEKSGSNSSGSSGSSASGSQRTGTRTHAAEPEMVFVQGGTFWMGCSGEQGSDCESDESPLHSVTLSDFHIGKYEVTQAQWRLLMGTTVGQQRDKADPSKLLRREGDNYPVYYVSWEEAQMFIERLNVATGKKYRLPTEAEWEYAARGGNKSKGTK